MIDWLTPDEVMATAPDRLGVAILRFLTTSGTVDDGWWGAHNFAVNYLAAVRQSPTHGVTVVTSQELLMNGGPVAGKLAEAWAWLDRQGYVIPDSSQGNGTTQFRVMTDAGRRLLESSPGDELAVARAAALLGDELHPRIEKRVRRDWNDGDYESAIFKAAREVEIAVREAAGVPTGSSGVPVMNKAFGKGGKLVDADQDAGEQDGTRSLYAGFVAVFKNPGSHRHWAPDDPLQAAGIIRAADLLLRMLDDRVAALG